MQRNANLADLEKMLQNASSLAIVVVDTADNELSNVSQKNRESRVGVAGVNRRDSSLSLSVGSTFRLETCEHRHPDTLDSILRGWRGRPKFVHARCRQGLRG